MLNTQPDPVAVKIDDMAEKTAPIAAGHYPLGKNELANAVSTSVGERRGLVGVGKRISAEVSEWKYRKAHIRKLAAALLRQEQRVLEGLNSYRLALSEVSFKSQKLDKEIWELYHRIEKDQAPLRRNTFSRSLSTRSLTWLRDIDHRWEMLMRQQRALLDLLDTAPRSVEFYNRIHMTRIVKQEQEVRQVEVSKKSESARLAVQKMLSQFENESQVEELTAGSSILRMEDARSYWNGKVQEISKMELGGHISTDELVNVLNNLRDTISEAPKMADRVKGIEIMFFKLISMHEELAGFGKNIISQEDLARMLITVQDEIPRLWAMGSWEKLNMTINEVATFVKYYELPVRSELSIAERRKPGQTRALNVNSISQSIAQTTPMIRSLVSAIDARDKFMRGHSDSVARMVNQIARRMNWTGEDLELLEVAALLHDVGKINIPEQVLTKVEPLTADEWKMIQMHPYHGAKIVKSLESFSRIVPWVYHHQERWDGSGYPEGLAGSSIPAAARIISVAEAFTVMMTDQPRRKALLAEEALNNIVAGSGIQFDPEVVSALVESFGAERKTNNLA